MPSLAELLGLAPPSAPWNSNAAFASGSTAPSTVPWWLRNPALAAFAEPGFSNLVPSAGIAPDAVSGGWLGGVLTSGGAAQPPTAGGILHGAVADTGPDTPASAPYWNLAPLNVFPLAWPTAAGDNPGAIPAKDSQAPMPAPAAAADINSSRSAAADFFQSIPRGLVSGLASTASANGQAAQIEMQQPVDVPSADQATDIVEQNVTGALPRPQGIAGQFGATTGEFLANPLTYIFPGSLAVKLGTAVTAALGSEAAGQLTKGTWAEPFARFGGAILGGGAGAAVTRGSTAAANAVRRIGRAGDVTVRPSPAPVAPLTGQLHHAIPKRVHEALEKHLILRGLYAYRDPRFATKAIDPAAHKGWETWHRQLDNEIANYIRNNQDMSPQEFENFLRSRYGKPDLLARFPKGL